MVAKTIIAQYVKEMRKKYKLTQVDLSEKAGVGLRFVRELEQSKATLRLDKVNKVFELFGSECGPVPMKREGDEVWKTRDLQSIERTRESIIGYFVQSWKHMGGQKLNSKIDK